MNVNGNNWKDFLEEYKETFGKNFPIKLETIVDGFLGDNSDNNIELDNYELDCSVNHFGGTESEISIRIINYDNKKETIDLDFYSGIGNGTEFKNYNIYERGLTLKEQEELKQKEKKEKAEKISNLKKSFNNDEYNFGY